ncbi:MAG: hybrid sensor histidine kinase/response regulator [Ardenticatenia bacterium]|nr:hybrid sensor histidine kinase/response regulator [Ardenticatenia bacterium]
MEQPEKVRVLVAEDSPLIAQLIKTLLERRGYSVVAEASTGREAVAMTEAVRPDLVVMDIQMPDMDGIEAAVQIRDRCPTPVVILTAYETTELVERASAAGVGAYLVKPPNVEEMERAIIIAMSRFKDMAELHERNRELNAFAHTAAHDLKNPLSVLIGFAELLEEDVDIMPLQERRDFIRGIIEHGHRAISIVDELLLLASLRQEEVTSRPMDVAEIVERAQERLADTIEHHKAEIILPGSWPQAMGHSPWIEEVWVNYLDNALKYGGRPPRAEFGATVQTDGMVRFWVRDNGDGLTSEEQGIMFMPFTRLDQVRTEGHGLGLSIVRRIVEKLGGTVGVDSTGVPGEGSLFYFELPQAAAPSPG